MNLIWCFVAVALVSTVSGAAVDVEKTIQQVEKMLQENDQLPRLSRNEIMELLNDIRAEDAKNNSASIELLKEVKQEHTSILPPSKIIETLKTGTTEEPNINDNIVDEKENSIFVNVPKVFTETTTKSAPSVMVVLPYTPKDASSLQELYTRPPRVEVVPASKLTPKPINPNKKLEETLKTNARLANKMKQELPIELKAFLDAHGLTDIPDKNNFLLPLEGFKPLPPAKVLDGTIQLPENILLAYDLILPNTEIKFDENRQKTNSNQFLFEPLRPELPPFDLQTSSSESKQIISYPYDMPKITNSAAITPKPNLEPIEYDSVKVIPLKTGPVPLEEDKVKLENDVNKRQTENEEITTLEPLLMTSESIDAKRAADNIAPDSDTGASITDLEDSFGGAAPEKPGDSQLPPPKKNGFYWMLDWNSFLEVGDGDRKVNIRLEPKLGDPQMFLPVSVP